MDISILYKALAYFRFLLLGVLLFLLVRRFSPKLAWALLILAWFVQIVAIVRDLVT